MTLISYYPDNIRSSRFTLEIDVVQFVSDQSFLHAVQFVFQLFDFSLLFEQLLAQNCRVDVKID